MPDDKQFNQALQEVSVLSHDNTKYGLPVTIFMAGVVLSIGFVVTMPWFIGVLFGVVYFYVMYLIHESDLRAVEAWRRALTRRNHYWSAGTTRRERFRAIDQ